MLARRIVASVSIPAAQPQGSQSSIPVWARGADEVLLRTPTTAKAASILRGALGFGGTPVTVVTGTLSRAEVDGLLLAGADRVYLWASDARRMAEEAVARWGAAALGVAVRARHDDAGGRWRLAATPADADGELTLDDLSALVRHAGDLLIFADDRTVACDETMRTLVRQVDVPVVVAGRLDTTEDLRRVLTGVGASGVVFEPGSVERFENVAQVKTYLAAAGIVVRGT